MDLKRLLKNSLLGILMGAIMGIVCASFNYLASLITGLRSSIPAVCYLMPLVGLVLVFLYKKTGYDKFAGSDDVMKAIRDEKDIPLIGSFASYFGMHLTNLSEGSAGREGGGFQIGAPIAIWLYKKLNLKMDRSCLVICAVAATFAPLWGIPLFATVFACEIEDGKVKIPYLIPALLASYLSYDISKLLCPFTYSFPTFTIYEEDFASYMLMALVVGLAAALISRVYVMALGLGTKLFSKISKNAYINIALGGVICVAVCAIFGFDYVGGSGGLIKQAFLGTAAIWVLPVRLFTLVIAIKSGYKTGLLTQTFTMGALTGCLVGTLFGWPCDVCAMLGIISMFTSCYNTKIAAAVLALFALKSYAVLTDSAMLVGIAVFAVSIISSWMYSTDNKIYSAQNYSFSYPLAKLFDNDDIEPDED